MNEKGFFNLTGEVRDAAEEQTPNVSQERSTARQSLLIIKYTGTAIFIKTRRQIQKAWEELRGA